MQHLDGVQLWFKINEASGGNLSAAVVVVVEFHLEQVTAADLSYIVHDELVVQQ